MRPLAASGLFEMPTELADLLRFGRGVDCSKIEATGFTFRRSSAAAVQAFAEHLRLDRSTGSEPLAYRYEHDVEQFFRHSPAVIDRS